MISFATIVLMLLLAYWAVYYFGKKTAVKLQTNTSALPSLPKYYGWAAIAWVGIPTLVCLAIWSVSSKVIPWYFGAVTTVFIITAIGVVLSKAYIKHDFNAQKHIEKWIRGILIVSASLSIVITIAIVLSVLFESIRFFSIVPVSDFLFGTEWSPQTALRLDQAEGAGAFGAIPVFMGTLLITIIAMVVATPLGLYSAIYISEYMERKNRNRIKPLLEILAGIPTVVYGYFAVITIAPAIRTLGKYCGLDIASESALAAGLVMGVMIIPFIMSLSEDVMNAVPNNLRDGSLALGATQSETITKVILPAALPGIMSAVLLGISRAVGETMIVVMAAGLAAKLTFNPLDSVTTVTVQIVTLLVGDQEFDSAKTLAAFALGLTLFFVTLLLNVAAIYIVKKYKEQYS